MCPAYDRRDLSHNDIETTVLGLEGIQTVRLRYCRCSKSSRIHMEDRDQLMQARLFPATFMKPRTVATFDLLDMFLAITLQGKVAGYDFYKAIIALTDNSGSDTIRVSYPNTFNRS